MEPPPGPRDSSPLHSTGPRDACFAGWPLAPLTALIRWNSPPGALATTFDPGHQAQPSDPGSPWQNPYVESFNSRARDELFARKIFDSILEAKVLYADWCHAFNVQRPHGALSYRPPPVFAKVNRQS